MLKDKQMADASSERGTHSISCVWVIDKLALDLQSMMYSSYNHLPDSCLERPPRMPKISNNTKVSRV